VLGLIIEQPDRGFGVERRLGERFSSARFSYSTAYNALYRLEKDGLVRLVDEDTYEVTPEGSQRFRAWLRAPTSMPVLREELHAKIALCEPRDLPRLIDVVHTEELACISELDGIRERVLAEQREATVRATVDEDWTRLMDRGVVHGEAAFWGGRIAQLGQLRNYLEELRDEAERRALREHRREDGRARRAG